MRADISLVHLEAFVQLASTGSFSKAARATGVSQPSVSQRVQKLERELGVQLVQRGHREVRLTDYGEIFLRHAERLLGVMDEAGDELAGLARGESGFLRIAAAPAISTYVVPKILKLFARTHPGVEVSVRTGHFVQMREQLLEGDVHLLISREMAEQGIKSVFLYDDEVIPVVSPQHHLHQRPIVSLSELFAENIILWDHESAYFPMIQGIFSTIGTAPKSTMEMDNVEAAKKMVEEGLGVALLPRIAVDREFALRLLVELPVSDLPELRRPIAVNYRDSRGVTTSMQAFIECVESIYRRVPATLASDDPAYPLAKSG